MANIQRRTTANGDVRYRVQVRLRGSAARSATFKLKADAERWAQQTESALRKGRPSAGAAAKRHTLAQLVERHLSVLKQQSPHRHPKQQQILGWWRQKLGARTLAHLTPALISAQRDILLRENIGTSAAPHYRSAATANRYLAALSKACTVAVREWRWMSTNPVLQLARPKEAARAPRFLSKDEQDALLLACGKSSMPELELIVMLALTTGMRRSELRALRWTDIELKRGSIIVQHARSRERRAVPLVPAVLALLGSHAQQRRVQADLVFARRSGNSVRALDFDHAFLDAVRATAIKDFRFQDLRHAAASFLELSGATLAEIAALLGHKTLAGVRRYEQPSAGD